jgi:hypothetical protein
MPSKKLAAKAAPKAVVVFKTARCQIVGCTSHATHLHKVFTVRTATHCKEHAQPKKLFFQYCNRLCEVETCRFRASFAPTRQDKAVRCAKHKLESDVNREKKPCTVCKNTKPNFGPPGKKGAVRCGDCRIEGDVDLNNDKCIECEKHQVSAIIKGREDEGMIYCLTCAAKLGLEYANGRVPHCITCKTAVARFGTVGGRPRDAMYCGQCRNPSIHFDLVHDMCEECEVTRPLLRNGRWLCLRCCIHVFPDFKVSRNYKTKQTAVEQFLAKRFSDKLTMIFDRQVTRIVPETSASAGAGGTMVEEVPCKSSGSKPDVLIDMGEWVVVVEVDENQHKQESYEASCENKRVMQIFDDAGRRPIVFVRFNPDNYVDASGNKVRSPWTDDRRIKSGGVPHVSAKNQAHWNARLEALASRIEHAVSVRPIKEVTFEYLYFDGC